MESRMYDNLEPQQIYVELPNATGTIEADDTQQERLEEYTERVASGEFHHKTDETTLCKCVDGRTCNDAAIGLNSAGGLFSYVVADDLTSQHFAGEQFTDSIENTVDVLREQGQKIGAHTGSHANDEKSDCGANDRIAEIYHCIVINADAIRAMAEEILGYSIDDSTHTLITTQAAARTDFGKGAENLAEARKGGAQVERLDGGHREVVAVVNLRPGTTFDRTVAQQEFGDNYQAFNIDAWAFLSAAESISQSSDEVAQKVVALTYYNLATTLVLAGPTMRVVVLK